MRLLFTLALVLYGWSSADLHHWTGVPKVLLHLLEHHSDLGHHDGSTPHGHEGNEGHNPFHKHQHDACGTCSIANLPEGPLGVSFTLPVSGSLKIPAYEDSSLSDFSGSKWNPPRLI